MADIVGTTFACVQILDTTIKLKSLWQSIKGAPAEIAAFVDEIQAFHQVCSSIADQQQGVDPKNTNESVRICLAQCERQIKHLLEEAKGLHEGFLKHQKRTYWRFESTKTTLAAHKAALGRATWFLVAAQNLQEREQRQYDTGKILEVLNFLHMQLLQSAPPAFGDLEMQSDPRQQASLTVKESCLHSSSQRYKHRRGTEAWSMRLISPSWLFKTVLDLQITRATSFEWNYNFRILNVVGEPSRFMLAAKAGDIETMKELFSNGSASPFDVDKEGRSALHYAAFQGQLEACELLLQNGAQANAQSFIGSTPLMHASIAFRAWVRWKPDKRKRMQELLRLLMEHKTYDQAAFTAYEASLFNGDIGYCGDPEGLQIVQRCAFVSHASLDLAERFKWAMALETWSIRGATAELLETALGCSPIEPAAYWLKNSDNETLLFFIARCLGFEHSKSRTENLAGWRRLLRDAVTAGANLHATSTSTMSPNTDPFWAFFSRYKKSFRHLRRHGYSFTPALRLWVTELQFAGVNLVEYGERLLSKLRSGLLSYEWDIYKGPSTKRVERPWVSNRELPWRLISFSFGPEPDDWQAWTTNPIDELVGDFWHLIDNPEAFMPGAWMEYFDDATKKVRISPDKVVGRVREIGLE
ncbi:uncharacterized protein HMPREF1541_04945 [Cyphellophora europaea CBS 101466]|uniref:Uncharacterized protein n=1 Tax=Cyphellophora europaea (strain CBS 101466) TaxID=1220924 RepID=W2RVX0_CYPE1|nr:uncharacterized protein HMPREF1541_04945 [Cyphellophora europaea CBS 101466]ETN40666.1 hypothetical protein HMPREF1541_04945 [Cyphellophora europaea CBS 101466]